jgi:hypothetical protein
LIQSIEINYSPQGLPAFFEGTNLPVFIELSVFMIETEMQTADRYGRQGGDRLQEMWKELTDTIEKGAGLEPGGLNKEIKRVTTGITDNFSSSPKKDSPARTGT